MSARPQEARVHQLRTPPGAAIAESLRAAGEAGFRDGERLGYILGWRWGAVCGGVAAAFAGSVGVVACKALGWL